MLTMPVPSWMRRVSPASRPRAVKGSRPTVSGIHNVPYPSSSTRRAYARSWVTDRLSRCPQAPIGPSSGIDWHRFEPIAQEQLILEAMGGDERRFPWRIRERRAAPDGRQHRECFRREDARADGPVQLVETAGGKEGGACGRAALEQQ